jgi:hypothetical protein
MANIDEALLGKLNAAVAEHNAAEQAVTTAQSELVSKSKVVGQLLLEAKERHPKVKDFETFLKRVNGLKLSRAYDLLRLAGGRATDEELRQDARDRQRKSRAKKKAPSPVKPITSEPKPEPTFRDKPYVTESQEISIEERQAQNADLDAEPEPTLPPEPVAMPEPDSMWTRKPVSTEKRKEWSRRALNEFTWACKNWLTKVTEEADRQEALRIVTEILADKKAKAA